MCCLSPQASCDGEGFCYVVLLRDWHDSGSVIEEIVRRTLDA